MAKNTKTPVMVLQELTVKKGYSPPNYDLVYCKSGTHDNTFHYQVQVLDQVAVGVGRSKKEAKHDAARKVLELLANEGVLQAEERRDFQEIQADQSNVKTPENCIPTLIDLCVEHKLPMPDFIEICAVGLAHCREFTYECKIANITTKATSGSKKRAKQFAAKDMLDRIMDLLPELKANNQSYDMEITDKDAEALEKYNLHFNQKMNLNTRVCDFDQQFKQLMREKEIPVETIQQYFQLPRTEETLRNLLNEFEFEFTTEVMQLEPVPIVLLSINSDIPLSFMEMADADVQEATDKVIDKVFTVLKVLML